MTYINVNKTYLIRMGILYRNRTEASEFELRKLSNFLSALKNVEDRHAQFIVTRYFKVIDEVRKDYNPTRQSRNGFEIPVLRKYKAKAKDVDELSNIFDISEAKVREVDNAARRELHTKLEDVYRRKEA